MLGVLNTRRIFMAAPAVVSNRFHAVQRKLCSLLKVDWLPIDGPSLYPLVPFARAVHGPADACSQMSWPGWQVVAGGFAQTPLPFFLSIVGGIAFWTVWRELRIRLIGIGRITQGVRCAGLFGCDWVSRNRCAHA
ncbi:hypothetical protein FQZ97_1121890 [compost metagenome]